MVSTVQLLQPGVAAVWKRAFVVDMLVTVRVMPASSLCRAAGMTLIPCLGNCLASGGTYCYASAVLLLCCPVLRYAMLCYAMLCYAMLCYAVLCYALLLLSCAALNCAVLCY